MRLVRVYRRVEMNQPPPQQNMLATLVQNYVHYGNLAENYSKQATGARNLRREFEGKIINNLRERNMQNAIIQVGGARLQYTEEKTVPSLTSTRLQQYLHKYYAQRGNGLDETEQIMRFIGLQKEHDTTKVACLKKIPIQAMIPPPPQQPPTGPNTPPRLA